MTRKQLWDNMYRVIKANSGGYSANDGVFTEILDLQIPRGYVARIRKVIFYDKMEISQDVDNDLQFYGALVNDPDDETTYQIPTFTIDHDVIADFVHEYLRWDMDATGISVSRNHRDEIIFEETLDVVAPRNLRFNSMMNNGSTDAPLAQTYVEVYFTYEKISNELLLELLNVA